MTRLLSTEGVPQWNVWVRPSDFKRGKGSEVLPAVSRFTPVRVCPLNPKPLGGNLKAWVATL